MAMGVVRPSTDVAIVGAGPCGLAAAIAIKRVGLRAVVFDRSCVVSGIYGYPTFMTFFSTAEKLSIGGLPFVIAGEKPTRRDALAYYRAAVRHFAIPVRQFERVVEVAPLAERRAAASDFPPRFAVRTRTRGGDTRETLAHAVVIATGYFGSPNRIGVPGEDLPHVTHVYREGHEAFLQNAVVVGGGNSAAEAALDLWRCGARVTLVHFGPTFDKRIKPWVLPDFMNRVGEGSIAAAWCSRVREITPREVMLEATDGTPTGVPSAGRGELRRLPADHVYIMTGFAPNVDLLKHVGVTIDPATGIPAHMPETLETDIPGIFIAGVVVAGYDANKVFIENGRFHGDRIVARLLGRAAPPEPSLSAELRAGEHP
jgi:thioredoxin reductase (NADPH)